MKFKNIKKYNNLFLILSFLFILVCFYSYLLSSQQSLSNNRHKACTLDTKICPDGSSVGRTGPNCEFAQCSTVNNTEKQYSNQYFNISFTYPTSWEITEQNLNQNNTNPSFISLKSKDFIQDETDHLQEHAKKV